MSDRGRRILILYNLNQQDIRTICLQYCIINLQVKVLQACKLFMVMSPVHQVLAKTILQGTVKGGRRQGRQRKRWEDKINLIKEWTGLEFGNSQGVVENRENGGNWLRNHLWCPNDPRG